MRQHCAPYIRSEESHRRTEQTYTLSLWSWDISLTLNMTCFCLYERSEAISREGDVLQSIYFIALVVGYFAYAQYDVRLASSFGGSVGNADDRG